MSDDRGSVIAPADDTGLVLGVNRYDEYGVPSSSNSGRFQYNGQPWLGEIGMYYSRARMYDPVRGRFPQPDPIGYGDGANLYNAFGGDPVNRVDPSGRCQLWGKYVSRWDVKNDAYGPWKLEDAYWVGDCRSATPPGFGSGGGRTPGAGAGDGGGASKQPRCLGGAEPPRGPSPQTTADAVNAALREITGRSSDGSAVSPLNSDFARVNRLPDFSQHGWSQTYSYHSRSAWERRIPSAPSLVLKIYLSDSDANGENSAAITDPTYTARHWFEGGLNYLFGVNENDRRAADYLNSKRSCQ